MLKTVPLNILKFNEIMHLDKLIYSNYGTNFLS
jgi:hypothetical protein